MNLSRLIHDSRHNQTRRQHPNSQSNQQRISNIHGVQNHTHQPYQQTMASVLAASPYNNQANPTFPHTPQPPPSPPVDDPSNKCILPSIQTLIGMADSPSSQNESERPPHQQLEGGFSHDSRPYPYGLPTVSNPKALPLTPPLRPASGFDGSRQSPSESSSYYSAAAINNVEPHQQRQPAPPTSVDSYPMPRHPSQSPYANSAYASSPGAMSTYSYPSPANPPMTSSTMYYQRPIPSTFPPAIAVAIDPSLAGAHEISPVDQSNPWQHHHYISPSSSAAFAGQSQDRYICQTCNKAFSRPSSLRIHSHSHTGEKPFKCPHSGCGKAFSVRSNMKRHERGCHGGASPAST